MNAIRRVIQQIEDGAEVVEYCVNRRGQPYQWFVDGAVVRRDTMLAILIDGHLVVDDDKCFLDKTVYKFSADPERFWVRACWPSMTVTDQEARDVAAYYWAEVYDRFDPGGPVSVCGHRHREEGAALACGEAFKWHYIKDFVARLGRVRGLRTGAFTGSELTTAEVKG